MNLNNSIHFGHQGEKIMLLHANAYTPECYKKFAAEFTDTYQLIAPKLRPLLPHSDPSKLRSWNLFAEDLIDFMDLTGLKNIRVIGHSLGAVTALIASYKRPDLFKQLVLIDPVILQNSFIRGTSILPFWIKKKYIPIVKIASKRRNEWASKSDVHQHFIKKKLFKNFDPDVYKDFVQFGTVDKKNKIVLSFPPEWEARIYATPPNLWSILSKITAPTLIIKAEHSDVITTLSWQRIQNLMSSSQFLEMKEVGHLIPFEKPVELADQIKKHYLVN